MKTVLEDSFWISGGSRSGKTTRLVEQFCRWSQAVKSLSLPPSQRLNRMHRKAGTVPAILVLAATGDNRLKLADQIATTVPAQPSFHSTTPLGFFEDEVTLFWPLLIQALDLRAQFPLRLRPETEQELAMQLWRSELDEGILRQVGVGADRMVRRTLDLFQLAAVSGTPMEDLPGILEQGFAGEDSPASGWVPVVELLKQWREWCLARGFLTYSLVCELYWQYLLVDPTYQRHLRERYEAVLADDVDDYPAIARHLFEVMLNGGAAGTFTYNPEGGIRVGLGADPEYMARLQERCHVENLDEPSGLAATIGEPIVELVLNSFVSYPSYFSFPASVQSIQTTSRSALLRETAEAIVELVKSRDVQPREIAAIAPGLDAIARYTITEILARHQIPVTSLKDQRPLSSSPVVRSLLTLLALVYPGLGRLVDRDAVAEMLVVLSSRSSRDFNWEDLETEGQEDSEALEQIGAEFTPRPLSKLPNPTIDPVRSGLLADRCFAPDSENPRLLPIGTFPRWDRLGYRAANAYHQILEWIEEQRSQQQQHLLSGPVALLDRAIQKFLLSGSYLPYDQLAALRELMETAIHYWEIQGRLLQREPDSHSPSTTLAQFIQLLRRGTVTANPFPVRPIGPESQAVTLSNIFQYRANRCTHRWHFWLDAGSPLWLSGGAADLFGAPLFLQNRLGEPWRTEDREMENEQRLRRILLDLLSRCSTVYLCHSELAVNGQEQTGPLLPLIHASVPYKQLAVLP